MNLRLLTFTILLALPASGMPGRFSLASCLTTLDGLEGCLHPDTMTQLWDAVLKQRWRSLCEHGGNPQRLVEEFRRTGVAMVRSDEEVELLELAFPTAGGTIWVTVDEALPDEDYRGWLHQQRPRPENSGLTLGILIPKPLMEKNRAALAFFLGFLERGAGPDARYMVRIK